MPILLDTGPFALLTMNSVRISDALKERIGAQDRVLVSAISFYEIGQKVRLGKWADMAPYAAGLEQRARDDGYEVLPLSAEVATNAALMEWEHRDPFDRMIAAVAMQERVAVVSQDAVFEAIGVERVW